MAGVVDIVNQALSALGEARITSLDDPGQTAGLARSLYDTARDAEISGYSWNFARARVMLPAMGEKPAFGWDHQYLLPPDCLRVLEAGPWPQALLDDYIAAENRAWLIEGRNLLSNLRPPLNLIYLRRVEDPGFYPPVFVEVLVAKLAARMAERIIGATSKRELALKEYDLAVRRAKRLDAIQLPPQIQADGEWMRAHLEGGW
jgi:hypothetical protein